MLRRATAPLAALSLLLLLVHSGSAAAANVNFNGGAVSNCTLSGSTYSCTSIPLGSSDFAVIASGYTVVVSSSFAPAYNQGLTMSGTAVLQTSGSNNIDLSASNNLSVSGGTISAGGNFKLGASTQSITANVNAATITTAGSATYITGNVSASGAISFGSSTTVTGSVSAASITTGSATTITGSLTVSGTADLGSAIKVNGNVNANAVKTGSPATIGGNIVSSTTIDLGSGTAVSGSISGTTITTTSAVTLSGNINASTSFTLASGSTVTGNITAPVVTLSSSSSTVKGDITATTSLDIGSSDIVTGTVTAGSLSMRASGSTINGTTKISGDVDMASGSTINGDLTARNVTQHASSAVINGNAAVNSIYIDWGDSVSKTITCTGTGAVGCSCVTKADPNYQPTCGAATPSVADHILITHGGSALTCQPQSVTLTACANSSCSSTYTGSTTVTLTPGGGSVTFTGSTTATVSQSAAGTTNLATSATTTCLNTSTNPNTSSCAMTFSDSGLVLTAPDHVSMASATLNIQALKASANSTKSCVPLVQNSTVPLKFSCGYTNPSSGTMSPSIASSPVACNGGTTNVNVTFDGNGLATPALAYADVGTMSLQASYTSGNNGASGSTSFTTAPASFKIDATATSPVSLLNGAFARASDTFTLKVSAINTSGAVTPNFGRESTAESFIISQNLKLPSDGVNNITKGTFAAISSGVGSSTSGNAGLWAFTETGTITLNAALTNSSSYYLGKTVTGFNTKGTVDLRFVPHHFDTVLVSGIPMKCTDVGGYSNPCTGNTSGSFVYSKQGFFLTVNAYRDSSTISQNYRLKTVSADSADVSRAITLSAWTAAGGTTAAPYLSFTTTPAFTFSSGVGQILGAPNVVVLPILAFTGTAVGPTTVFLRAIDADGATSLRSSAVEAPLTIVSGGMMINNAYGSSTSAVPVEVRAMYFSSAAATYLFNPTFSPVSSAGNAVVGAAIPLATSDGSYATCTGALSCTTLQLVAGKLQFSGGKGSFSLAAPKASGSVLVRLKQSVIDSYIPYLPMINGGTVTTGVSRPGPVVYTREVYN
nr:DUF6701 domain-containing protein [Duganella guangzhouensis]